MKNEVKFLGLVFDKRLDCKAHVKYLKEKCRKALNILRVVGHTDWGADKSRPTLLKLYRTLVRSKLDYGCAVYGSTKNYILKLLDPIHHQGLRIALGAFRTSPVQSLYAEAGEPSLRHRRLKLSMNYFLKLKSLPDNPCHNVINNPPPFELFERNKTIQPFGTRTLPHIEEANIEPNSIDSQYERTPPLGNTAILCSIPRYHASRKSRRVKQFLEKNTSSCENGTTRTLKPTQTAQRASTK